MILTVEFRNWAWFGPRTDEMLTFLKQHGLAYVTVDAPRSRLTVPSLPSLPALTAPTAVFRLHGRNVGGHLKQVQGKAPTARTNWRIAAVVFFVFRLRWVRRTEREYLRGIAQLAGDRLTDVAISFKDEDGFLTGTHSGRSVAVTIAHFKNLWSPGVAVACSASVFFSLGEIDGASSYAVQVVDADVREAVGTFIHKFRIKDVSIDAVPSSDDKRLRVLITMSKQRPSPSASMVAILDDAVQLARVLEDRFGTLR